jgi:hypothetical protein
LELGGFWSEPLTIESLAAVRTPNFLIASLLLGDDGALCIEPTTALCEQMKRVPTLKLTAYDSLQSISTMGGGRPRSWAEIDEDGAQVFRNHS